jgi:DNA modification methylase
MLLAGSVANALYYGDNLQVLKDSIADESVDLIYLDPPFNSNATYNVLFRSPAGAQSPAQIEAFEDTWHWGDDAERAFDEVLHGTNSDVAEMLRAMRSFLHENDMMAYLAMMAIRLLELHRVLKPTGSLYLHCDPTAGHYLKILMDAVFGARYFRSEIVWKRSGAHSDTKQGRKNYGHIHDVLLFYSKSDELTWNPSYTPYDQEYIERDYKLVDEDGRRFRRDNLTAARPGGDVEYDWRIKRHTGVRERWVADIDDEYLKPQPGWDYKSIGPYEGRYWAYSHENMRQFAREGRLRHTFDDGMPEYKRFLDEMPGVPLQDVWTDISPIVAGAAERLGYATQKPVALLERVIETSSNAGDIVLDPFCGCGTAIHAAQKLDRSWIGIDITHLAISLIEKRLRDAFPMVAYEVHGTPKDLEGARALATADKYQFQWWAVSLVNAVPYGGKKKGADSGIDGFIYFKPDAKNTEKVIVSVKGGENINVAMVRDLAHVVEREKAKLGLFITLCEPTGPMKTEAVKVGFYETEYFGKVPCIQILTIDELLAGKKPDIPAIDPQTFKKAARETTEKQAAFALVAEAAPAYKPKKPRRS